MRIRGAKGSALPQRHSPGCFQGSSSRRRRCNGGRQLLSTLTLKIGGDEADNRSVGWRERDWAKFTDEERRALFGGGSLPPHDNEPPSWGTAAQPGGVPRSLKVGRPRSTRRRGRRVADRLALVATAGCVVTAVVFAWPHLHLGTPHRIVVIGDGVTGLKTASPPPAPAIVNPPADLISIRWGASELAPAASAGRICVHDARHGTICASYVAGEKPADNLTRRIESLGLRVQSSG